MGADDGAEEKIVDLVLEKNRDKLGKDNSKILNWFVGQVMKESKSKSDPQLVRQILMKKL